MTADTDIAEVAQAGLADVPEQEGDLQPRLEGTDYTKVKFVGVSYDSLDSDVKIGDEMSFIVRGRVIGVGDEAMADGYVRHQAKVRVDSVVLKNLAGEDVL